MRSLSSLPSRPLWALLALALLGCSSPDAAPAGDASAPDVATASDAGDPCRGVPPEGRCVGAMAYDQCLVPNERDSRTRLRRVTCGAGEACQMVTGEAQCVLTAECREGDVECLSNTTLRTCTDGRWTMTPCTGGRCVASQDGAACAMESADRMLNGRVTFEARTISSDRMRFVDADDRPLRGAAINVFRGSSLFASTFTSTTDGSFAVSVPNPTMPGDTVVVIPFAARGPMGRDIAYAVLDPGLSAGEHEEEETDSVMAPRPWSWRFSVQDIGSDGVLRITEAEGAGVASVFDHFGLAYREAQMRFGREGEAMLLWMGRGVTWKCGACVTAFARSAFRTRFPQQMNIGMSDDRTYYALPVIGHEAGHWAMNSFGRSPNEGGTHNSTCGSYPGLAWSEGFATWFGQTLLNDPLYWDNQGGFFWRDFAARRNSEGRWNRPTPTGRDVLPGGSAGLLQLVAEDEVTAILWALSNGRADAGPIFTALASPRMLNPVGDGDAAQFERGYRRFRWTGVNLETCAISGATRDVQIASVLPDFLDALACGGFSAERIEAAVEPAMHYPYDPSMSMCRR